MSDTQFVKWEDAVAWLKRQPDSRELVEACFFDDPHEASAQRYADSAEWIAVRALIPSTTGTALDIGAGRGISSYALAKDGWKVTALEPDPSMLIGAGAIRALADATRLPIDVVETWGEELPFQDDSFDLVHCRQVLHHARDLKALCAQIARVLRPGGTFIATREHVISRVEDLPAFLDSHPLHNLYGGEHAYQLNVYKSAIRAAGIELKQVINPFESPINLHPQTLLDIKRKLSKALWFPFPALIPDTVMFTLGAVINRPGRLYSFVGRKRLDD